MNAFDMVTRKPLRNIECAARLVGAASVFRPSAFQTSVYSNPIRTKKERGVVRLFRE